MTPETGGAVGTAATERNRKLEIRLLGTFDVRVNGQPLPPLRSRKEQWLLALLTLRHDQNVSRDWLATTFWPDNDESQARFYLRKALSNLRKALGVEAHRLQSPTTLTTRLDLSSAFADVLDFDAALAHLPQTDAQEAVAVKALALYRGPLLQDCLEEWEWLTLEREARGQAYLSILEAVASRARARGEAVAATRWLRRAMAVEPYRESAARSLMQALADSGDRAAVRQVYQELRARLREHLSTTPAPETDALYKRLSEARLQPEPPSDDMPSSAAPSRRHVPVPLTDLLGRETAIAEVGIALERSRLVTLVGAGGVGKTRLAIAAADAALLRFADGVWFVDLAALTEGAYVAETTARALEVPEEAGESAEGRLLAALQLRSALVVLDNCEHLLEACAQLAGRLLSACPDLRILSTSRQALGVTGEQVYPVPSLALPPSEDTDEASAASSLSTEKSPAFLREYAGIELFVQRAVQANPAFRLDRRNASAVCDICRHLDGIPLAIELAAARVRSLSVGEIASRLSDRFRLLTRGSRSALPRQQTLRALINWSYDLLTDSEKLLLARLSVFAGDWTLDAAENVCGGGGLEPGDVLDALTALVEKNLAVHHLAREPSPDEARYSLLETIRQYAAARLVDAGEVTVYRRRHADYCLTLVEDATAKRSGPEQARWLDRLEADHDNLRQALAFYGEDVEEDSDGAQKGLRLVTALSDYWIRRDRLDEARQYCGAFLARDANAAPTQERAKALLVSGNLAFCQGDNSAARNQYEEARAVHERIGDRPGLAGVLGSLGNVTQQQGDYASARCYFEECLALTRESGNLTWQSSALTCLASVTFDQGDYAASRAYNEAALALCRQQGGGETESIVLNFLGLIARRQSLPLEAIRFYEQALALDRELGRRSREAISLFNMANAYRDLGENASAAGLYREALSLINEGGDLRPVAGMLEALADFWVARSLGFLEPACRLLGATEKMREESDSPCTPLDQEVRDAALARIKSSLLPEVFSATWAEGRALTTAQVIAYALRETETAPEASHPSYTLTAQVPV